MGWGPRRAQVSVLAIALAITCVDTAVAVVRVRQQAEVPVALERPLTDTSAPRSSRVEPPLRPSTTSSSPSSSLPSTTTAPEPVAPATSAVPDPTTTSTSTPARRPPVGVRAAGADRPARGAWTLEPFEGVGAWIDVYDWTFELTGGQPSVFPDDIDRMADLGVQTLYIQTAHRRIDADVIELDHLIPLIDRAHARGLAVVAWYLPSLVDLDLDLRRLVAAARLPLEGLGVDIESLDVADPADRTRRLLDLSNRLHEAVGTRAIAAITPSAVHLQEINPRFWPGFPWSELAGTYDAILPMAYWSIRRPEWRSGERYIGENIDRIRALTGRPDVPIHPIGGIADGTSVADVEGMVRAIASRGAMGGSLYDWSTSNPALWDALRPLHAR